MTNPSRTDCPTCGGDLGDPEVLPIVHYGKSIYAVNTVEHIPCTACEEVLESWPAPAVLSDLAQGHLERPLCATFDVTSRSWQVLDPSERAVAILACRSHEEIHSLAEQVMDERDYLSLPALIELTRRPYSQGWRGSAMLPIWFLCSAQVDGEDRDECGARVLKGHWSHLVDLVIADTWETAHHAACTLSLIGLPKTLRSKLEAVAATNEIARDLLGATA